jgi:hypothetical protein
MITHRYTYDDREAGASKLFDSAIVDGFFDRDPIRVFCPQRCHEKLSWGMYVRWEGRKRVREKRQPTGGRVHQRAFRVLDAAVLAWVMENCRMPVKVWATWGPVCGTALEDSCAMVTFWHDADALAFKQKFG